MTTEPRPRGRPDRHDYTAIDAALLDAIGSGKSSFLQIEEVPVVAHECARLGQAEGRPDHAYFRIADRRLQVLRRSGRIKFARATGWTMADAG
jgi:hypothetical protein